MLTDIDHAALHSNLTSFDHFLPLVSDSMQTNLDLPNLDLTMFPEFSLPIGDSPFAGSFGGLHIDNDTSDTTASRAMSDETLPSLSPGTSLDGCSIGYRRAVEEHDHVGEVEEGWPVFRCNPLKNSATCPPTSGIYLDGLLNLLKTHETWSSWIAKTHLVNCIAPGRLDVEPFDDVSREKLTAVIQGFLHYAFGVHQGRTTNGSHSQTSPFSGFMILPPANALQSFLSAYIRQFENYHDCCPGVVLNPNWLLHQSDANLSSMLVLLMLAFGAAADSTPEARYFSSGLVEVCRISWQNVVERDPGLTTDPAALLSGLLLTSLQAWSGDKTFMEVAMGQRDSYINVSFCSLNLLLF